MNRKGYTSDPRYSKGLDDMDLLGITDISTTRQAKNGTIVWRLPIKHQYGGQLIEVASFKTGYVRNQNCGYSNYQLNKRVENQPTYYKDYEWVNGEQKWTGKYRKFTTRGCELIPDKRDRLEYLITYCLKNYYIKQANMIEDGKFVPKWVHEERCGHFLKCKDTDDMVNFEYSGGQITNLENGDTFVHEQHAYWNKWKEDKPSSVDIIIDGHRYKVK